MVSMVKFPIFQSAHKVCVSIWLAGSHEAGAARCRVVEYAHKTSLVYMHKTTHYIAADPETTVLALHLQHPADIDKRTLKLAQALDDFFHCRPALFIPHLAILCLFPLAGIETDIASELIGIRLVLPSASQPALSAIFRFEEHVDDAIAVFLLVRVHREPQPDPLLSPCQSHTSVRGNRQAANRLTGGTVTRPILKQYSLTAREQTIPPSARG